MMQVTKEHDKTCLKFQDHSEIIDETDVQEEEEVTNQLVIVHVALTILKNGGTLDADHVTTTAAQLQILTTKLQIINLNGFILCLSLMILLVGTVFNLSDMLYVTSCDMVLRATTILDIGLAAAIRTQD